MKKAIILAAMLALPAFAGQRLIYSMPAPQPVKAAVAEDGPAFEIGYFYSWAANDIYKAWSPCKEIRTNGVDLTGVYGFNRHHAVTLRLAYAFGARSWADGEYEEDGETWGEVARVRMHTFTLMPGYRYTHPLCSHAALYAGVNAGIGNQSSKHRQTEQGGHYFYGHASGWGFAYSAEAGMRFNLCPCSEFFVAYQFSGNTARNSNNGFKTHRQTTHGVRAGFAFKF